MIHCIEPDDFDKQEVDYLIKSACDIMDNPSKYAEKCKGKQLATLFYEPSTRTRLSFTSAMLSLGGSVLGFSDANNSSVSKGETLRDTIKIVSSYADIIAIRHPKEGAAFLSSLHSSVPVINAGDGSHSHPTQTLTDLLTIYRELGRMDNLCIGLCGDLKYGRTVHSLIKAMKMYENISFILISPPELGLPDYMIQELKESGIKHEISCDIDEHIDKLDILYMTRVQKERFEDMEKYEKCKNYFILKQSNLSKSKPGMIIMHPLPRLNEIDTDVDSYPGAAYFRQASCGKYIRMALILYLLDNIGIKKEPSYEKTTGKCFNSKCISQEEKTDLLVKKNKNQYLCAYCENILKK